VGDRLLYPQLILQAEEGDLDGALRTVRMLVYLTRPLTGCPTLMNGSIALTIRSLITHGVERTLAQGEPSEIALGETRQLLEAEMGRSLLLGAFRCERAMVEDTIRALDEGRLTWDEVVKSKYFADPFPWSTGRAELDRMLDDVTGSGFRRSYAIARLRHLTWLVEVLKESPDGLVEHAADWTALRRQLPRPEKLLMDMMARNEVDFFAINDAQLRCTVVALAAEQFRRRESRWPASLDELVPQFLAAVPHDPYDQQPLKLARLADGIVVYSVGRNRNDDGGELRGGADVGVRLWDVNRRRQPPVPAAAPGVKRP
jgi:hypothetical protein